MSMRDSHRLFLRVFMSRQYLSEAEIQEIYQRSCEACQEDANIDELQPFINTINKHLRPLFMEVRQAQSEDDGTKFYGLVNNVEDEHSKLATDYTTNDITFFKKAIELVVAADDGWVSSMDLLELGSELEKKMSNSYTETLMNKLTKDKWLEESSGIYSLGGRALLELKPYLKRSLEEYIVDCMMCKQIVIKGQTCPQCSGRLHKYCAVVFFSRRTQHVCPNMDCNAPWPHHVPTLPPAPQQNSRQLSTPSPPVAGPSRSRTRKSR
ncbi:non-structural maintenance of chromosomes element 1 homolog [Nematostella vectensis]|uniref:non-structural maintenance of chromosomes element 1 homolog n=1 Tax=Nematostella vectensis TaxID=45351 RepID=UPI0020771017|nr:non-structural maintenance of chromosomes element 1 homolog [Nematostella vectensis]